MIRWIDDITINPLTLISDQDRISLYDINTISSKQVMRIKIQYQILKTNFAKTVWQTVRRITNEILGVKGLKDLFLFNHIKQIDSMLWVCSVIDQKRHNTVLRTSVIHS